MHNWGVTVRQNQVGATLIVVLLFLVLIMTIGVIAVRQSSTDLKIATNDQVGTLLLNSSDSVHAHLEQAVNAEGSKEYNEIVSAKGAFGYFMNAMSNDNRGDQIIFCYNPRQKKLFSIDKASVLTPGGGKKLVGGTGIGYCDATQDSSYTSTRHTTMAQIMVTRPDTSNFVAKAFDGVPTGRDINIDKATSAEPLFEVHSTAILPALATASDAEINDCFAKPSLQASRYKFDKKDDQGTSTSVAFDKTLSGCMQEKGVPTKVVVEQARMRNITTSKLCIGFGKSTGSVTPECKEKYKLP